MRVVRFAVLMSALMATSACVFYPTGSGTTYEEVHHYHDDGEYYVPAAAKPDRVPLGYGEAPLPEKPCHSDDLEPWEDTPCEQAPAELVFQEDFEKGLGQWTTCAPWRQGYSWKADNWAVLSDEEGRIPGGVRLGATWIESKATIDLRKARHPKLRIQLKGGDGAAAVQFRLIWAVAGTKYVEERPIGEAIAADRAWTRHEFDLAALKKTQGHLRVVARVDEPDGGFDGPMIDAIALYDARD